MFGLHATREKTAWDVIDTFFVASHAWVHDNVLVPSDELSID